VNARRPNPPVRESKLVIDIMVAVKSTYPRAYVRKFADRYTRGLPDLLILFHTSRDPLGAPTTLESGVILVEVKNTTGRLREIQKKELEDIQRAGGQAVVARSVEDVLSVMRMMGGVP
jgi:hypothetical protein